MTSPVTYTESAAPSFLFDLDGTLIDSVYQHVIAWRTALAGMGIDLSVWRIHRRIGMSGGLFVSALLRETGLSLSREEIDRLQRSHADEYRAQMDSVLPLPGAADLLGYLSERDIKWAIATSGNAVTARPALKLLGLPESTPMVTRDLVRHAKPDPDLFLAAAALLNVDPRQAMVVGDSVLGPARGPAGRSTRRRPAVRRVRPGGTGTSRGLQRLQRSGRLAGPRGRAGRAGLRGLTPTDAQRPATAGESSRAMFLRRKNAVRTIPMRAPREVRWRWSREESGRRFAVSGVRRVFAGVHGSLGSLQALRYAASEARQRRAPLVPVIAWVPPGGDLAERRQPNMQLRKLWRDAAREKLFDAFEMGLGGLPEDLDVQPLVVRGPVGPVLVDCADDADDLLVVGTGRRGVWRLFRRSASRYCLAHAHCPVIAVPPSALMEEASHGLQIWPRKPRLPALDHPEAWLR